MGPPLLVLPLPFITLIYWVACRAMFWRPQEALALADAAALDAQDKEHVRERVLSRAACHFMASFKFGCALDLCCVL